MNLTTYHVKYFAYDLIRKNAADDPRKLTASLQDVQVDLNPHQVIAALFAFKSPLSRGVTLAHEVGLGKVIEAGIILPHLCGIWNIKITLIVAKTNWIVQTKTILSPEKEFLNLNQVEV